MIVSSRKEKNGSFLRNKHTPKSFSRMCSCQ